jgi:O-antigen ligase/polysaccharide polymerase Wzy-like membrane protein
VSRSSAVAARAFPLILGGALAAVAFGARGGTELTRTTITEVAVILAGAVVLAMTFLWSRPGRPHGRTTVLLFALLALLTSLSVLWSISPELTYIEVGRTLAYLAVFTSAVAGARLFPRAAPQVLWALLIGAMIPIGYALASRVWPGALAENEVSNRLGQPFDYWNAVGSVAAMAVPILLWLGSRKGGSSTARTLAYPLMSACILAIILTQSRGAAAAALVGALAWFVLVPLRLRSLPVLLLPTAGAVGVGAWALSQDPFTKALQPLSAKESVAGDFGMLVLLMLVLLMLVGAAVEAGSARRVPTARMRRRIGVAAVALACLVPLAAFTSVAFSDRGIGDRISELTSETKVSPQQGGGRVFAASSSRGKYWREAWRVFKARPLEGVGGGAFAVARLRFRNDTSVTRHAHGWFAQILADFGIVGLVLTTLLFLTWLLAALSATGLLPRRLLRGKDEDRPPLRRDWDAQRIALVTVLLVPVVYGAQSVLDWTWFIPAPTVMALIAAGYLAGRGPLGSEGTEDAGGGAVFTRRPSFGRIAAGVAAVATAALIAWAVWQPEASDRATNDALALADEKKFDAAIERTKDAEDINPLTPDPLLVRASIDTQANRVRPAEHSLQQAVISFPGDPQTWYRLAAFQLGTLDAPEAAVKTIRGALYLDPHSGPASQLFLNARARLREKTGRANPAVPG